MEVIPHRLKDRNYISSKRKIIAAILLNLLIVVLQMVYGLISNSVSLFTDGIHNLQDVISLFISMFAIILMSRLPTTEMTFGFVRSEALAGFVNSIFLVFVIVTILIFSINRLIYPKEVEGLYVLVFGLLGFVINFVSAKILIPHNHEEHLEDLNIKAAYLHLLSDAGISLGVFLGGLLVYLYNLYWVDPLFAIMFSLYILKENLSVLRGSYKILMEAVPEHIDIEEILDGIRKNFEEIKEIHDMHIWSLSSKDIYLSAHIVLRDGVIQNNTNTLKKIVDFLKTKGINHITIQLETEDFRCEILH